MHDANGTPLKVGDHVIVPCVITNVAEGQEHYCNVEIETELGRRPDEEKERFSAINTAQLVLIKRPAPSNG